MEKDQYQKELDRLREKYTKYRKKISSKIRPGKKKPKIEKYYYDPKTRVGIKIQYPSYIEVISDYNVISLQVHYKIGDRFFGYDNKGLNFFFKKEDPEKVFMRFKKKFNGNAERKRIKEYLRLYYPKEMLIDDRADKINELNKKAV